MPEEIHDPRRDGFVDLAAQRATVIASIIRTLTALGQEPLAADEALREVELRGRVMHGLPPRDPAEWEHAALVFSDDALDEFRRWEVGG